MMAYHRARKTIERLRETFSESYISIKAFVKPLAYLCYPPVYIYYIVLMRCEVTCICK